MTDYDLTRYRVKLTIANERELERETDLNTTHDWTNGAVTRHQFEAHVARWPEHLTDFSWTSEKDILAATANARIYDNFGIPNIVGARFTLEALS